MLHLAARVCCVVAASVTALAISPPAGAMGSGNPYEDLQVGVTYTVYEPTYTSGLKLSTVILSNQREPVTAVVGTAERAAAAPAAPGARSCLRTFLMKVWVTSAWLRS